MAQRNFIFHCYKPKPIFLTVHCRQISKGSLFIRVCILTMFTALCFGDKNVSKTPLSKDGLNVETFCEKYFGPINNTNLKNSYDSVANSDAFIFYTILKKDLTDVFCSPFYGSITSNMMNDTDYVTNRQINANSSDVHTGDEKAEISGYKGICENVTCSPVNETLFSKSSITIKKPFIVMNMTTFYNESKPLRIKTTPVITEKSFVPYKSSKLRLEFDTKLTKFALKDNTSVTGSGPNLFNSIQSFDPKSSKPSLFRHLILPAKTSVDSIGAFMFPQVPGRTGTKHDTRKTGVVGSQVPTTDDIHSLCKDHSSSLLPHPSMCAWYLNCSTKADAVMATFYSTYVMECPYPQLFSSVTLQCEDFADVDCKQRFEPKSPCEYRSHSCVESSHCIPCWIRYSSCRGRAEGLNPWHENLWQPYFVECHKERTVFQGYCQPGAVFSPLTRACETPLSIPSQYGGWKPSCSGRRNGLYPDEFGHCNLYFECRGQLFRGFHKCKDSKRFNPVTSRCETARTVPYPCGDQNPGQQVCLNKTDGDYLDTFGRCTHYFKCAAGHLEGIYVCAEGVFSIATRQCEIVPDKRREMFLPCGSKQNECYSKDNGEHVLLKNKTCDSQVLCENGFTIAVNAC